MPPTSPPRLVVPESSPPVGSEPFRARAQAAGQVLRRAGIGTIYLVHGTFVGADPAGWIRALESVWPGTSASLRARLKQAVDALLGEAGNYTPAYARLLAESLAVAGEPPIAVRPWAWSGENHHLGRAEAAVELLAELAADRSPGRVLLWGHSHAGNVFALVTRLLADGAPWRDAFFAAAQSYYYQWPLGLGTTRPVWPRVRQLLNEPGGPLSGRSLDVVTFGTPIRYAWNRAGCGLLLHLIHHRPQPGLPADDGPPPKSLDDLLAARGGDYVQQLGGPGTNLPPWLGDPGAWWADRRMGPVVEPGDSLGRLPERLQARRQWSPTGRTLLVDYRSLAGELSDECFGHAIYTRRECLLFHLETVAQSLAAAD